MITALVIAILGGACASLAFFAYAAKIRAEVERKRAEEADRELAEVAAQMSIQKGRLNEVINETRKDLRKAEANYHLLSDDTLRAVLRSSVRSLDDATEAPTVPGRTLPKSKPPATKAS